MDELELHARVTTLEIFLISLLKRTITAAPDPDAEIESIVDLAQSIGMDWYNQFGFVDEEWREAWGESMNLLLTRMQED